MKEENKFRVQRKSVLQPAIRASWSYHVLAHKSFQLAPKPFLISRFDYNSSVIWISSKNSTCPSGKLLTKITSPIAKSTSHGLSDMTFFARWSWWTGYCNIIMISFFTYLIVQSSKREKKKLKGKQWISKIIIKLNPIKLDTTIQSQMSSEGWHWSYSKLWYYGKAIVREVKQPNLRWWKMPLCSFVKCRWISLKMNSWRPSKFTARKENLSSCVHDHLLKFIKNS